jgi:RND family efflux transporter MFP subunit
MKSKWINLALPVLILGGSVATFMAINTFAKQEVEPVEVDTRPSVWVEPARKEAHQIIISEYASVQPVEVTPLAAQVSGEVTSWHPNFLEGGRVKRGDLLFSIEKDAYEAALLQAEASLNQAQATLIEQQAQADVAADEAKRNPGRKYTDLYLRKPQVMSAKAGVKSAQAALRIAQRDLNNCEVYAPFDALVVARDIGVGQYLNIGSSVATLYNIEKAKIVLPIPGFDRGFLPENLAGVPVTIEAKNLRGVTREGYIRHDLGVVDEDTRMTHLLIELDVPFAVTSDALPLQFGSYVNVSFVGKTFDNVITLPQELVVNKTVWVVNDQSQLEARSVHVLREEGSNFLIDSGLQADERVVKTLPEYPQAGMPVKVIDRSEGQTTSSKSDQTVKR